MKNINKVNSISITMPAFNEEGNIIKVVGEAEKELKKLTRDYELVLVDDGSKDKTGIIIDKLAKNSHIKAVHHRYNKGFSGAILSCYKNSTKELVFLAPADGQFNFKELNKFIKAIKNADAVVGYRVENPETFLRKFNSWAFHFFCRFLLGIKLREISTVIMWKKTVLDSLKSESREYSAMIQPELIFKALQKGYKFVEVPIHFRKRLFGKPKGARPKMIIETFVGIIKLWWNRRFVKD